MWYLSLCKDLFPGLPAIIIINVANCDENTDLVHMPLRIPVKHIKIASIVKSLSGQVRFPSLTFFGLSMILQ